MGKKKKEKEKREKERKGENRERERLKFNFIQTNLLKGRRDINIIRCLINHKLPMNQANSARQYPMELLIKYFPDITLFRLMLSNGADPNIVTAGEDSLLRKTVKLQLYDLCIALLEAGSDVNMKDVDALTAYDIFANSAVALFKAFVLAGIDVNQHNLFGTYPLFLAISFDREELVQFILDNDADVNIVDEAGETSLTKAIFHGFDNIVQLLLRSGANVDHFCKRLTAVNQDKRRVHVHTYFEAGCRIHRKHDDQPEICLLLNLITNSQMPLEKIRHFVSSLLEFGADPNLEMSGKDSCLIHAVKLDDSLLVKTLLNANADIKHIGHKGYTALHVFFLTNHSPGTV
ncbi:putative ankyrin repeat protein RF_0381 [Mytilus edulis]|uniref:putative ankyrin repeat protein RF_0381 n=1 Tax=Mytilus edulis TaxID=6550 RepID=UPI0039EF3C77